jgi:hypothetical protein
LRFGWSSRNGVVYVVVGFCDVFWVICLFRGLLLGWLGCAKDLYSEVYALYCTVYGAENSDCDSNNHSNFGFIESNFDFRINSNRIWII